MEGGLNFSKSLQSFRPLSTSIGAGAKKIQTEALFTVYTLFTVSKDNSIQFSPCPWTEKMENEKGFWAQRELFQINNSPMEGGGIIKLAG